MSEFNSRRERMFKYHIVAYDKLGEIVGDSEVYSLAERDRMVKHFYSLPATKSVKVNGAKVNN